jgi:hypothetical protein
MTEEGNVSIGDVVVSNAAIATVTTARSLISKSPIYLNKIYILQWFQPFTGNGQLSSSLTIVSTYQLFDRDRKSSKT